MIRYRANSLCDTCSAESPKFFHGEKAIVDQQLCSKILRSCSSQYEFTVLFVTRSLSLVTRLYQALLDSGLEHEDILMLAIDTASEKLKAIQKLELSVLFGQLLAGEAAVREQAKARMCGLVTNLVHTPFIEQVSDHLAVISRIFGYLRLQLKKSIKAQQVSGQSTLSREKSQKVLAELEAQSQMEAARTKILNERWARAEQEVNRIKASVQNSGHPGTGAKNPKPMKYAPEQRHFFAEATNKMCAAPVHTIRPPLPKKEQNNPTSNVQNRKPSQAVHTTKSLSSLADVRKNYAEVSLKFFARPPRRPVIFTKINKRPIVNNSKPNPLANPIKKPSSLPEVRRRFHSVIFKSYTPPKKNSSNPPTKNSSPIQKTKPSTAVAARSFQTARPAPAKSPQNFQVASRRKLMSLTISGLPVLPLFSGDVLMMPPSGSFFSGQTVVSLYLPSKQGLHPNRDAHPFAAMNLDLKKLLP